MQEEFGGREGIGGELEWSKGEGMGGGEVEGEKG